MGFVYLLLQVDNHGDETYKIGVSKNDPNLRLKQLSTGNPNKISVLKIYESDNYRKVETRMHQKYNHSRTLANNEWFNLTNDDVLLFLDNCKKEDNLITFLKENNPFFK